MQIRESGEDYLEAILMLQQESGTVRSIDIAEKLGVTKASVSKAMAQLEARGLVKMLKRDVRLTDEGKQIAERMLERHVFFRDLLMSAGVEEEIATEEGCHMEHCLSEDSFQKLKAKLSIPEQQD